MWSRTGRVKLALVVSGPVLVPAMVSLGFNPLHVAIVMILALNVANITPPVGMTLMTASRIAEVPYEHAIRETIPFFFSHLAVILLVAFFPALALWLPSLLGQAAAASPVRTGVAVLLCVYSQARVSPRNAAGMINGETRAAWSSFT